MDFLAPILFCEQLQISAKLDKRTQVATIANKLLAMKEPFLQK